MTFNESDPGAHREDGEPSPGFTLLHTLRADQRPIRRIAWSPDGRFLAAPTSDQILIWEIETGIQHAVYEGHKSTVYGVAWSPDGKTLASGSKDTTICIWSFETGQRRRSFKARIDWVNCLAWSPDGCTLAAGGEDGTVKLWNVEDWQEVGSLSGHTGNINHIVWSPDGKILASVSGDETLRLWDTGERKLLRTLEGHLSWVFSVAWFPDGRMLASGSWDKTIRIWEAGTGGQIAILEGHTSKVKSVSVSADGRLLASKSQDDSVRIWRCDTWAEIANLYEPASTRNSPSLAFNPCKPVLATLGEKDTVIRIWHLDDEALISQPPASASLKYVTTKIVLVGDSGVGKTGLGWRLAHGDFREHPSTHGQQFWMLERLRHRRSDGAECESVLWDLAGQPDYRLIHGLFLDDADLALVLFDPTEHQEPLRGVEFWLQALSRRNCRLVLVGARVDRGEPTLVEEEIEAFCLAQGIHGGYLATSARTGRGVEELLARMKSQIDWDGLPATITTTTFKRIKQYVLALKEDPGPRRALVDFGTLRKQLQETDREWTFSEEELTTAVSHLTKHGYVRILRTALGGQTVLLMPELLNNLAASFVVAARANPKGLGSLDEERVLHGGYAFPELAQLEVSEQAVLLAAVSELFVQNNICFRETQGSATYLIFPELINRKKPQIWNEQPTTEDVSYTVRGSIENVYAALVVLLGYTSVFTRTDQWQNQAQYEVGKGEVCGFRQNADREGEIELVLYYGNNVQEPVRLLFRGLFETFLAKRRVSVTRYPPLTCPHCQYRQERSLVLRRIQEGEGFLFCSRCAWKIELPRGGDEITSTPISEVAREAMDRTRFEKVLLQIKNLAYSMGKASPAPRCFVSYAWGLPAHERWVEKSLASDLEKAGIDVKLDRWDNAMIGANIARFISLIKECDFTVVVATPQYRQKYMNESSVKGSVAAAEMDLINVRLTGTEEQKRTVLPVLREGDEETSLPPLMEGRVYADFRQEQGYFSSLFDLILTIYDLPFRHPAVAALRQSLLPGGEVS